MKLIRPVTIDDNNFGSSTVAEADYAAWTAGTYTVGTRKIYLHRIWEVLASSTTDRPDTGAAADTPTWVDVGPTNRWAMFDRTVGTLTTDTGEITVHLQPGAIDSLGVLDTDAEQVTVSMSVGVNEVYNQTQSTNESGFAINDWYHYFFDPLGKRDTLTFFQLPSYDEGALTVRFIGADPAGPVSVGTLIVGRALDLGITEANAEVGIIDFSKKETDDFGATDVIERAFAKRMTVRAQIATSAVGTIQRELAKLRAIPVLWIGQEGFDSLTIYGFYKEFSLNLAFMNVSYCSLTVEGLV